MKKFTVLYTLLFGFSLLAHAGVNKDGCKVTITVEDQTSGKLLMRKLTQTTMDTFNFANSTLEKMIDINEPTPVYLSDEDGHYQIFFVEPKANVKVKIKLKGGLTVSFLEGSVSNEVFRSLIVKQDPVQKMSQTLSQKYQQENANKDSINMEMLHLNEVLRKNFFDFLNANANSEVASFVVYSSIMNERNLSLKMADTLYQILQGKARTNFYGKELAKTMEKLKSVEVGYIAPDFTLSDSSGKSYTLRKIKAEYILLDFWASWCGPCKAEIPSMKKAYEKFHDQGFEIVSVSVDQKVDAWKAALVQFQMPWIHLIEKNRTVSDLYHFPTIPKTVLMDKTGKILATDLRGEALDMKLTELYKK